MKQRLSAAILALLILGAPAGGFPQPPPIERWVQELGNPDPRVRENAFHELRRAGFSARKKVFQATFSDNPQIRSAAAEVLMLMTWTAPDDPPQLRQRMIDYGTQPEKTRLDIATALVISREEKSTQAVLRIIAEDRSPSLAWALVELMDSRLDPSTGKLIESLDLEFARAPILVLAAKHYLPRNRDSGIALLRRAIESDPTGQVYERDPLEWAFERLVADSIMRGSIDEAASIRRSQEIRTRFSEEANARAVFHLFALHAHFGPAEGFEEDLNAQAHRLCDPGILYALSRLYERAGMRLLAGTFANIAIQHISHDAAAHQRVAQLLATCDWYDFAERELLQARAILRQQGDELQVTNINLQLSAILERAGSYSRAADALDAAIRLLADQGRLAVRTNLLGESEPLDIDELRALANFYRFKQARLTDDRAAQVAFADATLKLNPSSDSIAVEIVPFLESLGRKSDADALFERAQGALRNQLTKHPDHAGLMNELAWLLARTGRNTEEAYRFASRAAEIEPDNPSFIDTLAEAAFRTGRLDDAIAHSRRSIELRPTYAFFRQQLARFEAARAASPSR